jgi:hypothetical protein
VRRKAGYTRQGVRDLDAGRSRTPTRDTDLGALLAQQAQVAEAERVEAAAMLARGLAPRAVVRGRLVVLTAEDDVRCLR